MQPFVLSASRQTATSQSGQSTLKSQKDSWVKFTIASLLSLGLGFSLLNPPNAVAQSLSQTSPKTTKPALQGDTIEKNKELLVQFLRQFYKMLIAIGDCHSVQARS